MLSFVLNVSSFCFKKIGYDFHTSFALSEGNTFPSRHFLRESITAFELSVIFCLGVIKNRYIRANMN